MLSSALNDSGAKYDVSNHEMPCASTPSKASDIVLELGGETYQITNVMRDGSKMSGTV